MDWRRAKTILIMAFAVLDLALGALWWGVGTETPSSLARLRSSEQAAVRDELAEIGVVLSAGLPEHPPSMRRLGVSVRGVDPRALAASFFSAGVSNDGGEGADGEDAAGAVFRRGSEQLTILPQGIVFYERRDVTPGGFPTSLDREAAVRTVESFLRSRNALPDDTALDHVAQVGGGRSSGYRVLYVQRYQERDEEWPLFSGYVGAEVIGDSVRAMESFLLDVVGFSGERVPIIAPYQALRSLVEWLAQNKDWQPVDRLLVDRVELGYFSRIEPDAVETEVDPVWRVLTRDGKSYYVNVIHPELVEE